MADAGKIAPTYEGEWSAIVRYDFHSYVTHNGNCYIAKQPSTGVEPVDEENEYWFLALKNVSAEELSNLRKLIEELTNGTTPVGDSKLLNGLTATEVGASGARNLIPYPYASTTVTSNGITWTDNGDGTVTANGTATDISAFTLMNCDGLVDGKIYTLTGCPSSGAVSKYRIYMSWSDFSDIGSGYTGEFKKDIANGNYLRLQVAKGVTVNNLTFRPMLEIGKVAHDYIPYHSGGAEDALKLNGLTAEEFVCNPNLIINSDFKINQRGKTEYNVSGEFTVDRWRLMRGSTVGYVKPVNSGIHITTVAEDGKFQHITNKLEGDFHGKTLTLSVKVSNVVDFTEASVRRVDNWSKPTSTGDSGIHVYEDGIYKITFTVDSDYTGMIAVLLSAKDTVFEWVKLEIGSVATPFIQPNKEVEKLKCGATVGDADTVDGYHASDFLQNTGGTLSGSLTLDKDSGEVGYLLNRNYNESLHTAKIYRDNSGNLVLGLLVDGEWASRIHIQYDGTIGHTGSNGYKEILHTGNSAPVAISATAPSNTTTLWYDTTNKKIKAYIDGAWTATA